MFSNLGLADLISKLHKSGHHCIQLLLQDVRGVGGKETASEREFFHGSSDPSDTNSWQVRTSQLMKKEVLCTNSHHLLTYLYITCDEAIKHRNCSLITAYTSPPVMKNVWCTDCLIMSKNTAWSPVMKLAAVSTWELVIFEEGTHFLVPMSNLGHRAEDNLCSEEK